MAEPTAVQTGNDIALLNIAGQQKPGQQQKQPVSAAISPPNLGLFLGTPSWQINPRGLEDCLNVRISKGKLTGYGMGWAQFFTPTLNGPCTLVDTFIRSFGTSFLIFGTPTDLYSYSPSASPALAFITPTYNTGSTTTNGTSTVTGAATLWATNDAGGQPNVNIGDQISFQNSAQNDPNATWFPITAIGSDTSLTVTGSPNFGAAQTYTIRKVFHGDAQHPWHGVIFPNADINGNGSVFTDAYFATNGGAPQNWNGLGVVDWPFQWNGSTISGTYSTAFAFAAGNVQYYKNMLIWMNITKNPRTITAGNVLPTSIINSDAGRPNTYVGGISGQFIVGKTNYPLLCAVPLSDDLIFYTQQEVIDCSFAGAPTIFAFRSVAPQRGALASRLVAAFPDYHQYVGLDSLYWFNGASTTPVDGHVWRDIVARLDKARLEQSFCTFDLTLGELLWAVCTLDDGFTGTTTGPQFAYVAHYMEGQGNVAQPYLFSVHPFPYTKRNFPFAAALTDPLTVTATTWSAASGTWASATIPFSDARGAALHFGVLAGGNDGRVMQLGVGNSQGGAGYNVFAKFPRRFVTDVRHRSLIRRVYPYTDIGDGTYPLTVTTYVSDQPTQPPNGIASNFDLTGNGTRFVAPYRRGIWGQVMFSTPGTGTTGQPFVIHGYDWDVVIGSER